MKGHLSPWMFVVCGAIGCDHRVDLQRFERAQAALELRRLGWRWTAGDGWICPTCATTR